MSLRVGPGAQDRDPSAAAAEGRVEISTGDRHKKPLMSELETGPPEAQNNSV